MTWRTYVDGNSLGFAAHTGSKQKLYAGGKETTAIFGLLRSMQKIARERTFTCPIVLWDGRSWRYSVYPEYKGNRDTDPKKAAERERYKAQRPAMFKALHLLGVRQLIAGNMEADDLAGFVTRRAIKNGDRVGLITGDQDWLQLVEPGVTWIDHKIDRKCNAADFKAFTGFDTPRQFIDGKALKGDSGDNIKPKTGIGEKGAVDLLSVFPSVEEFLRTPIDEAADRFFLRMGKKMPASFVKFHGDSEAQARFRWALHLMDLNHPDIPTPKNLRATHAPIDREAFQTFCAEFGFQSILSEMDRFLAPFISMEQEFS